MIDFFSHFWRYFSATFVERFRSKENILQQNERQVIDLYKFNATYWSYYQISKYKIVIIDE